MRVFHSADGRPLKASFESDSGVMVNLMREDGKVFELKKSALSTADQTYVAEMVRNADDESKKLNIAAGHEISNGIHFSERKAEDLARALQIRPESKSKYGNSWRLYASYLKGYLLFGAMPYSVALYSNQDGFATNLSIVYANKGDFVATPDIAKDRFKNGNSATPGTLSEAMARDEEMINKTLTAVLGEGKVQRYGELESRRRIIRWDWRGYAFLLSNEKNEYVSLAIVSSQTADSGGRYALTKDGEVKERLLDNIVRKDNGDVYLSEIPMVDQGPKGYCVPATFERAMRTMGLEADMYLLAMVGQTGVGGGTSPELLLEKIKFEVISKKRRIKEEKLKQLHIRDFKRYIDEGIPIMWSMHSMEAYNDIANKNTEKRAKVTEWNAYASEIITENVKLAKSTKPDDNRHICMIIGYNETTQEIAVSDSWGPRFERRWVPVAVADWANSGNVFMILP